MPGAGGCELTDGDGESAYANTKSVKLTDVLLCTVYVLEAEPPAALTVFVPDPESLNSPASQGCFVLVGVGVGLGVDDGDGDGDEGALDGGSTAGVEVIAVGDDASATFTDAKASNMPASPVAINVRGRIRGIPRFGHEVEDRPYQSRPRYAIPCHVRVRRFGKYNPVGHCDDE